MNVLIDDDPAKCNEIVGTWPLKRLQARVYKADAKEINGLVELIERLCLAKGEARPDLSEEDRDLIRAYSLQAMSSGAEGADKTIVDPPDELPPSAPGLGGFRQRPDDRRHPFADHHELSRRDDPELRRGDHRAGRIRGDRALPDHQGVPGKSRAVSKGIVRR